MRRIVSIVSVVVLHSVCPALLLMPLCAYSPDDSSSTEFRENLLPAQQGDAKAQVFVAYLYETGQGVNQNYAKAAEWYSKAAQQGNPVAQTQLGNMYRLGKGVPQNYVLAYMWLDLATRQGSAQAVKLKGNVTEKMTKDQIAEAKKLLKNWKAVK
ncbi:MAG TPA: tetratricopeptide repeat protein [Desulfomonilia bacterium]|nr:tetratricopeptide repeat protein [Desulfomonilia bacterium]